MSDVSISKVYQFLSNYNKSGDWSKTADKNDNGIISELEAWTFLDNNFFQSEGLSDKEKDDIFYKFWKSMDTDTEGKVRAGSKVNDKGALNDEEINNVQKNIQIAERVDNFVNNNIRGKEPSVISNKTGWLNSVKDGMTEKAFDYITQNKNAELSDAKLREFYELTYRKATADYYFAELKNEIGKDLSDYKVGDDASLKKVIDSYIQSLNGDTTTSIETIIAKVKELVEAYKDTADTNSKTDSLERYGYDSKGSLNDLQIATLTDIMFNKIVKYLQTNNSDIYTGEYIAKADNAIKSYISKYLGSKKASDFVSLKAFDISTFVNSSDFKQLVEDIKNAQAKTRADFIASKDDSIDWLDDKTSYTAYVSFYGADETPSTATTFGDLYGKKGVINLLSSPDLLKGTNWRAAVTKAKTGITTFTSSLVASIKSNGNYYEPALDIAKEKVDKLYQSALEHSLNNWADKKSDRDNKVTYDGEQYNYRVAKFWSNNSAKDTEYSQKSSASNNDLGLRIGEQYDDAWFQIVVSATCIMDLFNKFYQEALKAAV